MHTQDKHKTPHRRWTQGVQKGDMVIFNLTQIWTKINVSQGCFAIDRGTAFATNVLLIFHLLSLCILFLTWFPQSSKTSAYSSQNPLVPC